MWFPIHLQKVGPRLFCSMLVVSTLAPIFSFFQFLSADVPESWNKFSSLPSQAKGFRPVSRLLRTLSIFFLNRVCSQSTLHRVGFPFGVAPPHGYHCCRFLILGSFSHCALSPFSDVPFHAASSIRCTALGFPTGDFPLLPEVPLESGTPPHDCQTTLHPSKSYSFLSVVKPFRGTKLF